MRKFLLRLTSLCVVFALAVLAVSAIRGCSIVERVKYELAGADIGTWDQEAAESGIVSQTEEYHYNHLQESLRETYREMYVRMMKNEDSGDVLSAVGVDDFWKAYYAVLSDHPEIFWIGTSAQVEESGLTGRVVSYSLETTVPVEARDSMRAQLEAAADECIARIPPEAGAYERIKFVYDYLIDTVEYNAGSQDSQNIQSALLYHSSVCAGYSKAFQYILNRMGMFCTYVTGQIRDGGDHGWNMVRIDDEYYYVDVTWGDPVFANQVEGEENYGKNYNYLCCTEYDLFKTHVPDDSPELPPCTSDAYNYYRLNGSYYESFDYGIVYDALMQSVWNGNASINLKFGSQEAYDTAVYELFQNDMLSDAGQYLMEINGTDTWSYHYQTDANFYLITIYW